MIPLVAYTDGSGTRAHLPSGAGVVIYDGDPAAAGWAEAGPQPIVEASRHLGLGTNNHAELSGVRIAIWLSEQPSLSGRPLIIRSDSEYVLKMLSWRGVLDPERPNSKLINIIRRRLRARSGPTTMEYVKGHSKDPGNERADELAGLARLRPPKPVTAPPLYTPEGVR
jgi:ribonuclease HI